MSAPYTLSQAEYEDIIKKVNAAIQQQQAEKATGLLKEVLQQKYEKPIIHHNWDASFKMKEAKWIPPVVGVDLAKAENDVALDYSAPFSKGNQFTTGTGQVLKWTHDENPDCEKYGCVIHHPTDPHQDWPTHWQSGIMWRKCPCGELHPDLDHCNFAQRKFGYNNFLHYCTCKCCEGPKVDGHAADLLRAMGLTT